jgi:hypothetical protein
LWRIEKEKTILALGPIPFQKEGGLRARVFLFWSWQGCFCNKFNLLKIYLFVKK